MKQVQIYEIVKDEIIITTSDSDYFTKYDHEVNSSDYARREFFPTVKREAKIVSLKKVQHVKENEVKLALEKLEKEGYYEIEPFSINSAAAYQRIEGTKHVAIFGITPEIEEAICGKHKSKVLELENKVLGLTALVDQSHNKFIALDSKVKVYNNLPWYRRIWRKV